MTLPLWLKGIIIGFSIAAPVGPIGILCIRRTLSEGRLAGFLTGLGAASADAVYGSIAVFGVTAAAAFFSIIEVPLRLGGGIFLAYLGVKTFMAKPGGETESVSRGGFLSCYASTFFLTLTNPATIISFGAVFAALGLVAGDSDYFSAAFMVVGIFLGSALWWLVLSGGVGLLGSRINYRGMTWINRLAGTVLTAFGLTAVWSGLIG